MRLHTLLGLQIFQVAILLLHDWIPLPPLNDVRAARRGHTLGMIALGTAISSLFPSIGLALSLFHLRSGWPQWLHFYLLAAYGFLFVGELEAWWVPYLVSPQPKRAVEYEEMYGNTYAFLPRRNGIRINALHFLLHAATLITLLLVVSLLVTGR
ncbi:MAG TPA: hypothetical protein VKT81_01235 [Bryobacteraceae bacterium]|nr:hypothetical protein [Bryobacteraceae bacterium]